MFSIKEVFDRDSVARSHKQAIAQEASLPILKLIGVVSNEELRERLDSAWQNSGVLSAFVAAIAVSFLFVEIPLDQDDEEYESKRFVKSLFFICAAAASVFLILAVSLIVTNLTTLLVCPTDYVDDFLNYLGPLEGVPSVLMVISIVALVAMIPMWAFVSFGDSTEFTVTLVIAIVATVVGLLWQVSMMRLQKELLDKQLSSMSKDVAAKQKTATEAKSGKDDAVVELGSVYGTST